MNDGLNITSYLIGKKAGGGGEPPVYQDKEVSITQNGTTTITKDTGYDALNSVELTVNVPQPSGKINITQNGTDIDVSSYATADVNVSGGATPTTPTECGTALKDILQNYYNYIEGIKANREAYTNDSVVLYTPNIECKHYYIRYRNNAYSVVWLNNWQVNCYNGFNPSYISANSVATYTPQDEFELNPDAGIYIGNSAANMLAYTSNETFSTPEALVQAMINNELTYTQYTGSAGFGLEQMICSNSHVFTQTGSTAANRRWTYTNVKIISHNETIVAMS